MNYTLTVLICVHSQNSFYDNLLIKSLRSLEQQTYKDFKTLIILDECWENTKKIIIENNFNLDIRTVDKKNKNGLSEAKNLGLSLINTELVTFLDGDDLYLPTKLEKQINYFKTHDVDFLGTHRWHMNGLDENNLFDSCFNLGDYETHEEIKNKLPYENCLTHGSMMIKMSCLEKLGYYNNVRGMEDWDLWKRAMNDGYKFHQIQERLYIYRLNTSTSR